MYCNLFRQNNTAYWIPVYDGRKTVGFPGNSPCMSACYCFLQMVKKAATVRNQSVLDPNAAQIRVKMTLVCLFISVRDREWGGVRVS